MRRGANHRAHLVQSYVDTALGERPRSLTTGQSPTHHDHFGSSGCVRGSVAGGRSRKPLHRHVAVASSASSTTILCPHLRQVRVSPSALLTFFSIPTHLQLGQVSATGRFQVEKSQAG